jgi:hypothetical protein
LALKIVEWFVLWWQEVVLSTYYPFEQKPSKAREPLLWTNQPTNG